MHPFTDFANAVTLQLTCRQWIAFALPCSAVAIRQYDTSVGAKEAQAYLAPSADPDFAGILMANYESEGRNILSTVWYRIPRDVSDTALASIVEAFNQEIDRTVGNSYAMRLARPADTNKGAQ